MKVLFFQQMRGPYNSVQILFDIIRQKLPEFIEQKELYFTYDGLSGVDKIKNIFSVSTKEKGDINHNVGEITYAALFMEKRKTILTIHDIYRLYTSNGIKKVIYKWVWLKLPIAKSQVVTAVSHATRDEILKHVKCSPSKVRVIYNCISPKFTPVPSVFNKEKPVLLQIGIWPNKNLERVIEALEGISCTLNIVGKPPDHIMELLKKHNIDFTCKFGLSQSELIQQYIDCDVVVFASIYEGFGVPIIEGNAVERVVVTGNCSAMKEVAADAACLVDPFDVQSIREGIKKVIEDDQYREQLIAAGRVNKMRFDAKVIADQYAELYQEVYSKNN
ncbi:MAG: glycosyltransferase family 1 protein [Ferruginibacter sp.]